MGKSGDRDKMNVHFIKSPEKRKIVEQLKNQFGISDLPYLLFETGKEKIRGFSGSLSKEEIFELAKIAHVEIIGIYLINKERSNDLRFSFDATQILQSQITSSIVEINADQFKLWIKGHDLDIKTEKGTVVIKYQSDFLGCGKSNGEKIFNYVPKDRRLRK